MLRRLFGRAIRRLADLFGFAVVRTEGMELVPVDRFDLVPKGQFDLVQRNYYSPVPDLSALPEGIWERRSDLSGIDLKLEQAIEMIERDLAPFVAELDFPREGPRPPGEFFLQNENYESVDAELLYAFLRARKPGRVVELGSGYTTLLIADACRRNAEDGSVTDHLAYDPYPRPHIVGNRPPSTEFRPISATEVPLSEFAELGEGDILFVDTTHTVKLGSDVNYLILDVLPTLKTGVIVHFHDIFLPWEYPRRWFEEMDYFWAEQYLLQAFLTFNDEFDVLLPAQAVAREYPQRLQRVIPSFGPGVSPAAFWLLRR